MKNLALALGICISLGTTVSLISILPCSYNDAVDGNYAGYGYHSLVKVVSEGLEWNAASVPEPIPGYSGTGSYIVSAQYWIPALYIPIFIAITYLGWLIMGGKKWFSEFIPLSRKSG